MADVHESSSGSPGKDSRTERAADGDTAPYRLWGAILPEERFLSDRFGAQYDDYRRRVRRWL